MVEINLRAGLRLSVRHYSRGLTFPDRRDAGAPAVLIGSRVA